MLDELSDWRKTHFSKDISSDIVDQEVIMGGWVKNYRDLGGLKFINLQDKYGERQITMNKGVVSDEVFEKVITVEYMTEMYSRIIAIARAK